MPKVRDQPQLASQGDQAAYPISLTAAGFHWSRIPVSCTLLPLPTGGIDAKLCEPGACEPRAYEAGAYEPGRFDSGQFEPEFEPECGEPALPAGAAIRAEAERARLAQEAAGLGAWDYDIRRKAVALSAGAAAMLGVPAAIALAPLRAQWRWLCHPDDRARVETALRWSIARCESFLIDCRLRSRDDPGLWRQVVLRGRACLESGRHRLLGVIIDVSDHHAARERLRQSTAMLRHAVRSAPGLLYTVDLATGREDHLNCGFADDFAAGPVRDLAARLHPEDRERLQRHRAGYAALPDHEQAHIRFRLCRRDGEYRWFTSRDTVLLRGPDGRVAKILCSALDVTDWRLANDALRALTAGMLRTQDRERRRIARDLHDSTAQNLLAATLALRAAQTGRPPGEQIATALDLIQQSQQEIRTLSYLLHPPLLDEVGLRAALSWYVAGYQDRTGIETRLVPAQEGAAGAELSLSKEAEIILFRVVQEALTNTYRHAGARTVTISLDIAATPEQRPALTVTVTDDGRGLPATRQGGGVGLVGMRERIRLIGGSLTILSVPGGGTTIRAACPADGIARESAPVASDAA